MLRQLRRNSRCSGLQVFPPSSNATVMTRSRLFQDQVVLDNDEQSISNGCKGRVVSCLGTYLPYWMEVYVHVSRGTCIQPLSGAGADCLGFSAVQPNERTLAITGERGRLEVARDQTSGFCSFHSTSIPTTPLTEFLEVFLSGKLLCAWLRNLST